MNVGEKENKMFGIEYSQSSSKVEKSNEINPKTRKITIRKINVANEIFVPIGL